jgi:hypothetical protein
MKCSGSNAGGDANPVDPVETRSRVEATHLAMNATIDIMLEVSEINVFNVHDLGFVSYLG